MGQMINVNIRMDEDLKKQADFLFNELGLNMSTAVNMFVRQAVRAEGIPFEISIRNSDSNNTPSYQGKMAGNADGACPEAGNPSGGTSWGPADT